MTDQFWKRKSLSEMSVDEWESLCDGCALCCLQKFEDEETGEVFFTDVACKMLDTSSRRCIAYRVRAQKVKSCLVLSPDNPEMFRWLPGSCAYRRLAEGKELPSWHPLVTGDPNSVHEAGVSVPENVLSEKDTDQWTVMRKLGD